MRLEQSLKSFNAQLEGLESLLLTVLLLILIALGLAQIIMRNAFGMALPWADGAMRGLVLWLAMVAGVVAAGRFRHIRIDLLSNLLPAGLARGLHVMVTLATAVICLVMSWLSLRIVGLEFEFQTTAFLGVKTWMVQIIVPIGFSLMAIRFVFAALMRPPKPDQAFATPDPDTSSAAEAK